MNRANDLIEFLKRVKDAPAYSADDFGGGMSADGKAIDKVIFIDAKRRYDLIKAIALLIAMEEIKD